MSDIKIEKDIPIPAARSGRYGNMYPFAQMSAGDSFILLADTRQEKKKMSRHISPTVYRFEKLHPGAEFITRTVDNGVRVWRVK